MTKIKICGLTRMEDIEAVNELLPDYIGFVFAPSRRQVTVKQAEALSKRLYPSICPVGVFVNQPEELITEIVRRKIIRLVQLHGKETPEFAGQLKRHLNELNYGPPVLVVKAVSMDNPDQLIKWNHSDVDFLLLDKGLGGTGEQFDHSLISRAEPMEKPWFLAGGMRPDNAAEAIRRFHPYGIDVSSGVETDGRKDREKIREIIERVRTESEHDLQRNGIGEEGDDSV